MLRFSLFWIVGLCAFQANAAGAGQQYRRSYIYSAQPDAANQKINLTIASNDGDFFTSRNLLSLARLNMNGTADGTFGNQGFISIQPDVNGGSFAGAGAAFLGDGTIRVVGTIGPVNYRGHYVSSLTERGQVDPIFGKAIVNNHGCAGTVTVIKSSVTPPLVDANGNLIAAFACHSDPFNGQEQKLDVALVRYSKTGELDKNFGQNGIAQVSLNNEWMRDAQFSKSKNFIDVTTEGHILRFNKDGTLHTSFGKDGRLNTESLGLGRNFGILELSDDSILVNASTRAAVTTLARLTPKGQLDQTYGTGGMLHIEKHFTPIVHTDDEEGFSDFYRGNSGFGVQKINLKTGMPYRNFGANGIAPLRCGALSNFFIGGYILGYTDKFVIATSLYRVYLGNDRTSEWQVLEMVERATGNFVPSFGRNGCLTIKPEQFVPFN